MNYATRWHSERRGIPILLTGLAALGSLIVPPEPVSAQGFRGWVGTTVQMVEVRPFGLDSVAASEVTFDADGRGSYLGRPVSCPTADTCTLYTVRPKVRAAVGTQDVSFTAWGFGVQGLSFTTLLRARTEMGGDLVWPRSDDRFDALLGYAQLTRGKLRLRVGRQEVRSGLGFPAFDGGSVAYTLGGARLEAYTGRSLARGLREPAYEALRGIEAFLLDQSVNLVGASARYRFGTTALTGRYHREILGDRSALTSERMSLDFSTALPGVRLVGSFDYDNGFGRVGKSHLTASMPFSDGRWVAEATARRYVPYFDLNTIWGFFEPVEYSEVEARLGWSAGSTFAAWASGGRRTYGDTNTTDAIEQLRDHGWRANGGLQWRPLDHWRVEGSYRFEWGPGAKMSSADVAARYSPSDRLSVTATGMTFQQIEEFRVGDGRAYGGGVSFDVGLIRRARLAGGVSILRHRGEDGIQSSPWNQTRAWSGLRIEVGQDPGLANRRRP